MHIGSSSLRSARSVLGAPPPCEACAARQGVPLPAWGEARHSCTRARRAATTGRLEAPPPTLPWRAAARAQFVRSTGRPTRPSVAASMKHHLRLHCPLVEYNLLVLTMFDFSNGDFVVGESSVSLKQHIEVILCIELKQSYWSVPAVLAKFS